MTLSLLNLTANYQVIPLSPAFDAATFVYSATVSPATLSVALSSVTVVPGAQTALSVGLSGFQTTLNAASLPMQLGLNILKVRVTSLDASTQQIYYIFINRPCVYDILPPAPATTSLPARIGGVAVDTVRNVVYVSDPVGGRILSYSIANPSQVTVVATPPGLIVSPLKLAIDTASNSLFVCDAGQPQPFPSSTSTGGMSYARAEHAMVGLGGSGTVTGMAGVAQAGNFITYIPLSTPSSAASVLLPMSQEPSAGVVACSIAVGMNTLYAAYPQETSTIGQQLVAIPLESLSSGNPLGTLALLGAYTDIAVDTSTNRVYEAEAAGIKVIQLDSTGRVALSSKFISTMTATALTTVSADFLWATLFTTSLNYPYPRSAPFLARIPLANPQAGEVRIRCGEINRRQAGVQHAGCTRCGPIENGMVIRQIGRNPRNDSRRCGSSITFSAPSAQGLLRQFNEFVQQYTYQVLPDYLSTSLTVTVSEANVLDVSYNSGATGPLVGPYTSLTRNGGAASLTFTSASTFSIPPNVFIRVTSSSGLQWYYTVQMIITCGDISTPLDTGLFEFGDVTGIVVNGEHTMLYAAQGPVPAVQAVITVPLDNPLNVHFVPTDSVTWHRPAGQSAIDPAGEYIRHRWRQW